MIGPPELPGFGDDALQQCVLGISKREPRGINRQAGVNVAFEPLQIGVAVALDIDHGQVGAFGNAQDPGVLGLVVSSDVDLEQRRAGDDVVVGHGDAGGINNEARAGAGAVDNDANLGIDKRPLRFNLDRRRLDPVQR